LSLLVILDSSSYSTLWPSPMATSCIPEARAWSALWNNTYAL